MNISDIRVRKLHGDSKMRAIVSITIDGVFAIHDIKVIEGEKGLFVAMPSKKASDGTFRDIAHPLDAETRTMLQTSILEAYSNATDEE